MFCLQCVEPEYFHIELGELRIYFDQTKRSSCIFLLCFYGCYGNRARNKGGGWVLKLNERRGRSPLTSVPQKPAHQKPICSIFRFFLLQPPPPPVGGERWRWGNVPSQPLWEHRLQHRVRWSDKQKRGTECSVLLFVQEDFYQLTASYSCSDLIFTTWSH